MVLPRHGRVGLAGVTFGCIGGGVGWPLVGGDDVGAASVHGDDESALAE